MTGTSSSALTGHRFLNTGAEDNASGVAVMLELARLAAHEPTRLPVAFVAFGAEEPRGSEKIGTTSDRSTTRHSCSRQTATSLWPSCRWIAWVSGRPFQCAMAAPGQVGSCEIYEPPDAAPMCRRRPAE